MSLFKYVRKLIFSNSYNCEILKKYLRSKEIIIDENTIVYSSNHVLIDIRKPCLIKIEDYCKSTPGIHILIHDYIILTLRKSFEELLLVIKEKSFGSNCIIGVGAVARGDYFNNVVIARNPAGNLCFILDFYITNKKKWIQHEINMTVRTYENAMYIPIIEELLNRFSMLYMPHNDEPLRNYFFYISKYKVKNG